MKLIDRLIINEILPIFCFGVIAFTALILGVGAIYQLIRVAVEYNADFKIIVQIILLKLPEIIAYTLPISALFCVLLGFNRFSNDLEIAAFRSAGISFVRIVVPVLFFGFFVSVAALVISDRIVPMSNVKYYDLISSLEQKTMKSAKKDNFQFIDKKKGEVRSIIFAEKMEKEKLINVQYTEMSHGRPVRETVAGEAVWVNRSSWKFKNGWEIRFSPKGEPVDIGKFDELDIIFDQNIEEQAREKSKAGEYTFRELRERIKALEESRAVDPNDLRKLKVDFYSKLSIPFASFAFVFIAAPLGLKQQRAGSSIGLGLSVIIIFIYYIVQSVFRGLGLSVLDPALAAWLPDILLCMIGVWLVRNASK